jgi:DNA anti-recombination protein RmuC
LRFVSETFQTQAKRNFPSAKIDVIMETMRATWTDERLDDLSKRVDDLGHRMDAGFARVDSRLEKLDERLDAMQRSMIQAGMGMTAAIVAALIVPQL